MQILEVSDMVPERRLTNPFRTDFSFRASSHSYSGNFERNRGLHGRKQRWHKHQRMASDGNKEDQGGGISTEELFRKELERRFGKVTKDRLGGNSGSSERKNPDPAPQTSSESSRSQLETSRKLNSEGLEGLIPRAKQLLSLGFTFWISFWPFILAISILTTGVSWLYGDGFIHGGKPSYFKKVSPEEVLSEPTVDKRIPFR